MRKTFKQKIGEAKRHGIEIPDELESNDKIVGVYGFFAIKKEVEYCFYIGKATNIAYRLLGSSKGHIFMYLNNNFSKLVPQKIKEFLNNGYKIEVRILDIIDYHDTSFSKAAHRLALAELHRIVEFQKMGQCEYQMPEGSGTYERRFWEKYYKISENKD
jgi:hypothetical protein